MTFHCLTLTSWLTTQQVMLCYHLWMDFQDIIRLRWLQKIWRKLPSSLRWGHTVTRSCHLALKMLVLLTKWATITLLHDLIHKEIEVYVDDMIMNSKDRERHIPALRKFFERIRFYKFWLNPKKCACGVTSGKLLGFIVSQREIEVDPEKIKEIEENEIRGFLGRIQYITRFIAQLTMTCEPIFRLLKKEVPTVWNEQCQEAFEKIKNYLMKPPILVPPIPESHCCCILPLQIQQQGLYLLNT